MRVCNCKYSTSKDLVKKRAAVGVMSTVYVVSFIAFQSKTCNEKENKKKFKQKGMEKSYRVFRKTIQKKKAKVKNKIKQR